MQKPERKHVLTLKVEADSLKELAGAINEIAHRIEEKGRITTLISGGYCSGYIAEGRVNEGQTGENYRAQNEAYVKQIRKAKKK